MRSKDHGKAHRRAQSYADNYFLVFVYGVDLS